MNFKRLLFLWLIMVMFSGGAGAQTITDRIVRSFQISTESTVEITNKYGKIHIKTWDKDSVRFEVDLKISTSDNDKLRKLKNQISFDFTSTNYYVIGKTSFDKPGGIFADVVETIIPSNSVSIDYTVYLPDDVSLKIENKFGDVFIDDFKGNLGLELSNGNLKGNIFSGNTNLSLSWCDAVISQIDNGKIEAYNSDLEIRKASKLNLDTKRSVIQIEDILEARVSSQSDKYFIDKIGTINGTGHYTKLEIGRLTSDITFSNRYYGIKIEDISKSFKFVTIVSEYTDVDLVFQQGASYYLDVTHSNDVQLMYPAGISKLSTEEIDSEDNIFLTSGPVGSRVGENSPKVKINANKKCYINIIHR